MIDDPNTTAPARPGEELDAVALAAFLRRQLPGLDGDVVVEQFPSGHSNLTYMVRIGTTECVLRRPPFGTQVRSAHDMGREYRVLSRLQAVYPPAPRPLVYCDDPSVIGAPFYLMERLRGLVIRKELPAALATDPGRCRELSRSLVDNLARLHSVDLEAAGLAGFGKPQGYVRRQIEGWSARWRDARTNDLPEMDRLAAWLAERMPPESGAALIHNDYKLDNVMLDPASLTTVTGVLDWEMATVGDPLMDLGTALSYWVEAADPPEFLASRLAPTAFPGFYTRREVIHRYAEVAGRDVPNPNYYLAYGLFKLAVILQQIFYRYAHGHTRDPRFAGFGDVVLALARQGDTIRSS